MLWRILQKNQFLFSERCLPFVDESTLLCVGISAYHCITWFSRFTNFFFPQIINQLDVNPVLCTFPNIVLIYLANKRPALKVITVFEYELCTPTGKQAIRKQSYQKTSYQKTKLSENKPSENKLSENKPSENKPSEYKLSENKLSERYYIVYSIQYIYSVLKGYK